MKKNNLLTVLAIFLIPLLVSYELYLGSIPIKPSTIINSLVDYDSSNQLHYIIIYLRLPRIVLAFLVGSGLALSGYLMQSLLNNPLADPYTLGTAAGGALGASVAFLGLPIFPFLHFIYSPFIFAFIGSLSVTILVVSLAYRKKNISTNHLLLAGISISSLIASLITVLHFLSDSAEKLRAVVFWAMGGLEKASWNFIFIPFFIILIAWILFSLLHKELNILLLGEAKAINIGMKVKKIKWIILLGSCFVTGSLVAICGPIGFVGLIVPHFVRGRYGTTNRWNISYCILYGGILMLLADSISRLIYPPTGLPAGIITSLVGIPFLLYLLYKKNNLD